MSKTKDFLRRTTKISKFRFQDGTSVKVQEMRERLVCKDGFSISIQADESHHCTPDAILEDGNYSKIELGFPSRKEPLLSKYMDDADNPDTETTYSYVPIEVMDEVIQKHGGVVNE